MDSLILRATGVAHEYEIQRVTRVSLPFKRQIDDRSFDLENCPNVVNTALTVAQTELDFTDVAYLGHDGVVPPAVEVPSSSTTRGLTAT